MPSVVILGANGFLGKTLLCSADLFGSVKAIVRSIPNNVDVYQKTVTWIEADLMNPSSFIDVLSEGDMVKVRVLEVDKQGRVKLTMKGIDQ